MKQLVPLIFLQEPDGSLLNVKDTNNYIGGEYPTFSFENYKASLRVVVFKHLATGDIFCYANVPTLDGYPEPINLIDGITDLNNTRFVFTRTTSYILGQYEVRLLVIPLIDNQDMTYINTNFKDGDVGFNDEGGGVFKLYLANKDYPKKVSPSTNGDWIELTSIDSFFDNINPEVASNNYTRIESASTENYFNAAIGFNINCQNKVINVEDATTYSQDESSNYYNTYFGAYTIANITWTNGSQTEILTSSGFNFTIPFESSDLFKVEFINLPAFILGAVFRAGDCFLDPMTATVYVCLLDVTLSNYAQLSDGNIFMAVQETSQIPTKFRKVYNIPVLCSELECLEPKLEDLLCGNCGDCKFCKCKGTKDLVSASVLVDNLIFFPMELRDGKSYKEMYEDTKSILKLKCNCG